MKKASKRTRGIQLWNEAKKIIPGGNQLLSKRSEMFLPNGWPAYYKRALGVEIWDLEDNRYIDMSIMGMGTCVLGYADAEVNRRVLQAIEAGNMSTLNCFEEVELAKRLIELHPWGQSVRFARTGGEACSVAVRIARAFSKKDKVLFCGYHGWSDWYLAANLADAHHLDGQLLPGLNPEGVPKALKGTSFPFIYGDIYSLEQLVSKYENEIGVIILEFARSREPDLAFLKKVQKIAARTKSVLIFDEVTSGFRMRAGGMHMLYGIEPDMVILGKAMGNGYPISAVIGKAEIMDACHETFISSTFWTERIGFAAACAVIDEFKRKSVPDHLLKIGSLIRDGLKKILSSKVLPIEVTGLAVAPTLVFKEKDALVLKTLFTQEMLKKSYLASSLIYVSRAHTEEIIRRYLTAAEEVFGWIDQKSKTGNLKDALEGPVCHAGFKRLT